MRRIAFVPLRLAALAVLLASPALAVQSDLTVLLDLDNDTGTGCTVSGFLGVEQRVVTTVQTTTGPNAATVTRIEGFDCSNTQTFLDTTVRTVGIGNGSLGLNVIETYWPTTLSTITPLNVIRLGVTNANANGGFDELFTNDGTPTGPPILFQFGFLAEIPTLSQWGALILSLLLAGMAAFKLRRRPSKALFTVLLVLCAGGVAWAIASDLDGTTTAEWSPGSRIAFDPAAVDDGDDIAALWAMRDDPSARLYLRIDASLVFNTPPVVTTTPGSTAFTEDGGPVVIDPGVTVTDSDSPNLASATVTITNPQDGAAETLAASACAGLTVTPGLNSLSITGAQPPATYQTCLQSVTYDDSSQNPSTLARTVSFVADDGIAASAPATRTVTVAAVNDAPVVTTTAGNTAFTEDGGPVVVDAGVTVTDVDNTNLASATVTVTNPQDAAAELLAAGACGGLTVTPGLNTLGITGSATLAAYQACLQSVTYDNTSQNPTALPDRVVSFVANDGTAASAPANKTVTVTPAPDAPVVTTTAGNTAFTEDGGPVVVDSGVTVTDVDDANLASATVTITNPQDGAAEVLAASACAGLTVTPGPNSLSISGSQPLATYQTCFQSVTYDNTSQNPTALPDRVVRFVANDGTNNSNNGDKTVTVAPVNDAPVVTTTAGNTAFTEDGGPVVVDAGVTVTDVDNANLASATVTIANPQDGAAEVLAATACGGITVTPGLNSLSLAGSFPLATYQTCLQSVTFDDTSQDPDTTARVISFAANDGTASSAAANKTVTVAAVNDAPVVTTTAGSTAFTEDGGPVVVDAGVTVTDADDPNLASATVTITNPQDGAAEVLSATACGGITVTPGLNSLSLSGSFPVATYQTCFQSVRYDNTSQNPTALPNRVVRFVANDGTANSNNGDKTVTVAAVNDAPVVTTTGGTTAFTEDGGPVVVDAGVTVTDADNANLASATVTITNPQDGAAEVLGATSCAGITVTPGLNTLSLTGSQPLATYQTCLQSVTFDDSSQNPNTTARVISFVANDGTASSTPATKTVTVAAVNDAPVVTTTGGPTSFTEDGGPVVVDSGVTVTDVDNANLASATVTITNPQDGAAEVLAASACAGITVTPGLNTLSLTGSQPLATYQTCLQSVTFDDSSQNPNTTARVISFVANDGAASSVPATKTVTVTAVNDAPVVTTTGGTTSFTEDGGPVVVDSGVTVTDVDNANLASATVTITNPQDGAAEVLAASACAGITVTPGLNTLSLTGSQPLATYQTCLQSVTFDDSSQNPNTTARVISFVANDGTASSAPATKTVTVTAVPDAPVVTTTGGTTSFTEDGGAVVVDSGVTVTDADSANLASATVTITNPQDGAAEVLAAGACAGITVTPGLNTLSLTGSQPLATYQTCLQSVTFDDTSQNPGTTARVVSFVANDGAASSVPATKTVTVTAVNDAPTVTTTGGTVTFTEDAGAIVVDNGLTVADVDNANLASATVTITNPQEGALEVLGATSCAGLTVTPGVNSLSITGSQPLATYQTCLRSVTYDNSSQDPAPTPNRIVSFVVNDGALSSTPATKQVVVVPVNDAPTCTVNPVPYATAGNTQLEVAGATLSGVARVTDAQSLLTKGVVTDPDGPGPFTVVAVSGNTGGGDWVINTDGSFTFVPDAGFTGTASRIFQVSDSGAPAAIGNCTVNVTVTNVAWYVRDVVDGDNAAGGDGRSTDAFEALASAQSPTSGNGHYIYVFEGNTATTPQVGGIALADGQKLWGQGIDLDLPGFPNLVTATNKARVRTTAASTNTVNVPAAAGNRLNVEVRGLDLEATGVTSNAIDVTSSGANQVGVTISDDNVRGATAEGIDLNNGSTGTFTATVSTNTVTSAGNGIDARSSAAGTMTVTADSDIITTSAGNGFDARTLAGGSALRVALSNTAVSASGNGIVVDGSAAGTTTITGFANNAVNGNTGGTGISVTSATFDVTPGGTFQTVSGGTTVVGASGNGVGAAGLVLASAAGDLSFTDLDVFADGGAGLSATGTTTYTGSAGLQVSVGAGVATIAATGGPAVSLNTVSGSLPFTTVSSTNTPTTGISLVNFADGGGNAVFSAGSGGNLTTTGGATGPIFNVSGGNAAITFGGNITNTGTGRAVSIGTWSGDDTNDAITLSGAIDENAAGILVNGTGGTCNSDPDGCPITFSGGMDIDTTTGEGFAATSNGGNVRLHVTGTNTIDSTSATALRVTSTTIGTSNLNFQHISSGNTTAAADPANGIVLNTTGNLGGLIVAGTGGSCSSAATCTGGAIQNTTSDGIVLNTTTNPSLTRMAIIDSADSGITIDAVSGLSLSNLFMDSNGAQAEGGAVQDSGIHIEDLIGTTNTITSSTVQESRNTNLDWDPNSSSGMSTLTVSSTNLDHAGEGVVGQGNAGINLTATGTANVKLVVNGGQIINNAAAGILVTGGSGTTVRTDIDAVDMVSSAPPVDPSGASWGNGVGTNFGISLTSTGTAVQIHEITNIQLAYTGIAPNDGGAASAIGFIPSGTGTFDITLTGNTIGLVGAPRSGNENFFGIAGDIQDSPTVRMNVSGNTIRNTALNGIFIQTRDPSVVAGNTDSDLTVRTNTVGPISDDDDFPFGAGPNQAETHAIRVEARNDSNLCLDINGNSADGLGGNQDYLVRQRDTSTYSLERLTGNAADDTNIQSFIVAQNPSPAGQTARSTHATTYTAVPDGTCANPQAP